MAITSPSVSKIKMGANNSRSELPKDKFTQQEGSFDTKMAFGTPKSIQNVGAILEEEDTVAETKSCSNSSFTELSSADHFPRTVNKSKAKFRHPYYLFNTTKNLKNKAEGNPSKADGFKKHEDIYQNCPLGITFVEPAQPSNFQLSSSESKITSIFINTEPTVSLNEPSKDSIIEPPRAKLPLNKVTCKERKRTVASNGRCPILTASMKQWVRDTNSLLDPFRKDDDCWLHPSPPRPRSTSATGLPRPRGAIEKRFNWQDSLGKHTIALNFGIVSKLVNFEMTNEQKDGFVSHKWHLSHLCGNWTCLNPAHTTVEPGPVNCGRNSCFSHRSGCNHIPKCMKEKKIPLGADGKVVDHSSLSTVLPRNQVLEYDDWSFQDFADGDGSMDLDENENENESKEIQVLDHEFGKDAPHSA